jgi:hypothetical protein
MSKPVRNRRTGKEALHTRVVQDKRRKLTNKETQEAIDDQNHINEIHYDGLHEFDDLLDIHGEYSEETRAMAIRIYLRQQEPMTEAIAVWAARIAKEAMPDDGEPTKLHVDQDMELDSPPFKPDALVDFKNRDFKRINRWLTLSELDEKKRLSKLTPEESELRTYLQLERDVPKLNEIGLLELDRLRKKFSSNAGK